MNMLISKTEEPKTKSTVDDVMSFLESQLIPEVSGQVIKVFTGTNWDYLLIPSVSHYLFEDINIIENLAPKGQINRPGTVYPKRYICVHDTGDHNFGAFQWSEAVRKAKAGSNPYNLSFQYVVGNDGWYHNIPDNELAYHAGDGHGEESLFDYYPSGVYADEEKMKKKYRPEIGISSEGFYILDGKVSVIKAPTKENMILTAEYINDLGIFTEIKEIKDEKTGKTVYEYYIGKTWYSPTYDKIANYGGNFNSIGIESCVTHDTDVHFTWQRTAKLVAKLMDENNFGIEAVVQHHYFSGKNCPQTIRTHEKWEYFKSLVMAEYQMLQYKKEGFKIEFQSLKEDYINSVGRVIKRPSSIPIQIGYFITVTDKNNNARRELFYTNILPEKKLLNENE